MFKPILRRNAPNLLRSTTQCLRAASTSRISIAAARQASRPYHASPPRCKGPGDKSEQPTTSFADLDVLGGVPPPSTSVDVCMEDGFGLNSGITISNGDGVLLLNAEAFTWRPWVAIGEKKLVNKKGQFHIPAETLSVIDLLWPRPDLLILGVGKTNLPLSPETRSAIAEMGLRVEVLDTRNAAAQFNLLATERGVSDVAAALIPMGWEEGVGAA